MTEQAKSIIALVSTARNKDHAAEIAKAIRATADMDKAELATLADTLDAIVTARTPKPREPRERKPTAAKSAKAA